MSDVVFRVGAAVTNGKPAQLIVDGRDITDQTLAGGLRIEPIGDEWAVTITLAVDSLEAELPEAVIEAARDLQTPRKMCEGY